MAEATILSFHQDAGGATFASALDAPIWYHLLPFYVRLPVNRAEHQGGSARTAARMLRRSVRNWLQPCYPHVYAAFRCVKA